MNQQASSAKHTPGPWITRRNVSNNASFVYTSRNPHDAICGIRDFTTGISPDEGKANAALIAAAPDLLAALRAIVDACDRCAKDDDKSLIDEFTEQMEADASAAIAKAEGRS